MTHGVVRGKLPTGLPAAVAAPPAPSQPSAASSHAQLLLLRLVQGTGGVGHLVKGHRLHEGGGGGGERRVSGGGGRLGRGSTGLLILVGTDSMPAGGAGPGTHRLLAIGSGRKNDDGAVLEDLELLRGLGHPAGGPRWTTRGAQLAGSCMHAWPPMSARPHSAGTRSTNFDAFQVAERPAGPSTLLAAKRCGAHQLPAGDVGGLEGRTDRQASQACTHAAGLAVV